jgi:hypothetical protein
MKIIRNFSNIRTCTIYFNVEPMRFELFHMEHKFYNYPDCDLFKCTSNIYTKISKKKDLFIIVSFFYNLTYQNFLCIFKKNNNMTYFNPFRAKFNRLNA